MNDELAPLGIIWGSEDVFGIHDSDRTNHLFIIGKTGTGKSTVLENLMLHDIEYGHGFAFIDPHGNHAEALLNHIPKHRIDDVIYLNVADSEYPTPFNTLAGVSPEDRPRVADAHITTFKHVWQDLWGTGRMQDITYGTIAALFDAESPSLLGIRRMLLDTAYREEVIDNIQDLEIKAYWKEDFGTWTSRYRQEATPAVMNKIRQFFNSSITRNILGQSTNTFDLGEVMDSRKILIVNLAKGKIGHERAALLGNFVISQIHLAAMRRTPYQHPQFDLFVDEARNFATDAIPDILSEARKYRLGLILAGQHLSQMDEKIQEAILGNVGTIAAFRVGPKDAKILAEEFGSKDGFTAFRARSIVELEAYGCDRSLPTSYAANG